LIAENEVLAELVTEVGGKSGGDVVPVLALLKILIRIGQTTFQQEEFHFIIPELIAYAGAYHVPQPPVFEFVVVPLQGQIGVKPQKACVPSSFILLSRVVFPLDFFSFLYYPPLLKRVNGVNTVSAGEKHCIFGGNSLRPEMDQSGLPFPPILDTFRVGLERYDS
jgi:hypothetical protein